MRVVRDETSADASGADSDEAGIELVGDDAVAVINGKGVGVYCAESLMVGKRAEHAVGIGVQREGPWVTMA